MSPKCHRDPCRAVPFIFWKGKHFRVTLYMPLTNLVHFFILFSLSISLNEPCSPVADVFNIAYYWQYAVCTLYSRVHKIKIFCILNTICKNIQQSSYSLLYCILLIYLWQSFCLLIHLGFYLKWLQPDLCRVFF